MRAMRNLLAIFSKYPLGPLKEMMNGLEKLVVLIEELLTHVKAGDFAETKRVAKEVMHFEHETDITAAEILDSFKGTMVLPMSKRDFRSILKRVSEISSDMEDLAVLFTLRQMTVPEGFAPSLDDVWARVKATFEEARLMIDGLDELIASGFVGPRATDFLEMVSTIDDLEWKTDKRVYKATQAVLEYEGTESAISIIMWMKILDKMNGISDVCQDLAKVIRRLISN